MARNRARTRRALRISISRARGHRPARTWRETRIAERPKRSTNVDVSARSQALHCDLPTRPANISA
jgi:hypothetical protein